MNHGGARIAKGVDHRYGRSPGMVVGGIQVDHFQPRWVCAVCKWAAYAGRPNFPHIFEGRRHAWLERAA